MSYDDLIPRKTIIDAIKETCSQYGHRYAMISNDNNNIKKITWKKYYEMSKQIAAVFIKLGLKENENISIFGFNSYEWFLCNLAIIMTGSASVAVDISNSIDVCEHIINETNSQIIIVENGEQLNKILSMNNIDRIKAIIQCKGELNDDVLCYHNIYDWASIMIYAAELCCIEFNNCLEQVEKRINDLKPSQCSTIVYSFEKSSKDIPLGIMLSHDNIIWTATNILKYYNIKEGTPQRVINYLPLTDITTQIIDIYVIMINAGTTWFSNASIYDRLLETKPTLFMGNFDIWDDIKTQIEKLMNCKIKKYILKKAMKACIKYHIRVEHNYYEKPDYWNIYNKYIFKKIKKKLGLIYCKLFLSHISSTNSDIIKFFASISIKINTFFGINECTGFMTLSSPIIFKTGSCGKRLYSTNIIINSNNNEICVKGRHVMLGYLNNIKTIINDKGFLHSNYYGNFNDDNFLFLLEN